jgi:hypothetical protein
MITHPEKPDTQALPAVRKSTGEHMKFREPQLQLRSKVARCGSLCAVKNPAPLITTGNLPARSVEISARGHSY